MTGAEVRAMLCVPRTCGIPPDYRSGCSAMGVSARSLAQPAGERRGGVAAMIMKDPGPPALAAVPGTPDRGAGVYPRSGEAR